MIRLQVRELPKKQKVLGSFVERIPELIKARLASLSSAKGYPTASALTGYVRNYLAVPDIDSLKQNLLNLRDILRFASAIMHTMPSLRIDRYQLSYADITNYMMLHRSAYGYGHLTNADLNLAAYLITSSEEEADSWLVEFDQSPAKNLVSIVDSLYRSALLRSSASLTYSDAIISLMTNPEYSIDGIADSKRALDETLSNMKAYDPKTDALVPFYSIIPRSAEAGAAINVDNATKQTKRRTKEDAARIVDDYGSASLALSVSLASDLRLIDHVASLLFDTEAWASLITRRPKPDPASNIERARGLSRLAGLCQSLLLYPSVLTARLAMETPNFLSDIINTVPTLPADLIANFNKYVVPYDVLGASQDAAALLSNLRMQFKQGESHVNELQVLPLELLSMSALLSRLGSIKTKVTKSSSLAITNLTSITGNMTYDEIISAVPIQRVAFVADITTFIATSGTLEANIKKAISEITVAQSDMYQKEIEEYMVGMTFAPWAGLTTSPQAIYDATATIFPEIRAGKLVGYDAAPFNTALNARFRQTIEVGHFFTERNYVLTRVRPLPDYPVFAVNMDHVELWNKQLPTTWKSLYPASLMPGGEIVDLDALTSTSLELELLLERLSGMHIAVIRRYSESDMTVKNWATHMSSGALLFRFQDAEPSLISGWGHPYGITYSQLAAMNADEPVIAIAGTSLGIMFIANIPVPSDEIEPISNTPYPAYAFKYKASGSCNIKSPVPSTRATLSEIKDRASLFAETIGTIGTAAPNVISSAAEGKANNPKDIRDASGFIAGTSTIARKAKMFVIGECYMHFALTNIEYATPSAPLFSFDTKYAYRLDALLLHLDPMEQLPQISKRTLSSSSLSWSEGASNMLKLSPGLELTRVTSYISSGAASGASSDKKETAMITTVVAGMEKDLKELAEADEKASSSVTQVAEKAKELESSMKSAAVKHNQHKADPKGTKENKKPGPKSNLAENKDDAGADGKNQ